MHQKIGIDLKHAVEFSSFGYTPRQPRQNLVRTNPGQLDQLYSIIFSRSNPGLSAELELSSSSL